MGNFSKDFGHSSRCCHHVRPEWKIHFSYSFFSSSLSLIFFCASFSFTHFPSNCHFDYHFFYFHLTIYFMLSFVCLLLSFAIHYTVRLNEWREERSIKEKRILVLISLAISFQVSKVLCKLLFGYECDCRFVCLATCIPSSTVCHMLSGTVYF